METSGDRNVDHFVAIRGNDAGQLRNSFDVAARSKTNIKFASEAENIAAFDGSGKLDTREWSKRCKRSSDGSGFAAPRFRAERKNDRQFVEHQRGIFHKHGIGQSG